MPSRCVLAVRRHHLGRKPRRDVRLAGDLVDQVVRHALGQRVAAHHQRHPARMVGEVQRRLAGRVAGADEEDVLAVGRARLAARGAVEDALADEPVEAFDRHPPPRHAGGEDQALRPHALVAVEEDLAALRVDPGDGARHQDLGAEAARLLQRAAGQLVARDAVRKAEVVLDPRRGAGLAARRLALDHQRAQALGGAVHRRRQPRRPAADDDGVVLRQARPGLQAELLGQRPQRRPREQRRRRPGAAPAGRRRPAARRPRPPRPRVHRAGPSRARSGCARESGAGRRRPDPSDRRTPRPGPWAPAPPTPCRPPMRSRASAPSFSATSGAAAATAK